jgi:D-glycero-D-manno-heptose 1,7-bisphosphate phosphatase
MPNLKNYQTLFLDRDGVINQRTPGTYVTKPEEFHFYEGVPQAIAQLSQLFDYIIIVTNQAGIGRGLMTEEDLEKVHAHLLSVIEKEGGQIDAIYHSPYRPELNSECRKPNVGMAFRPSTTSRKLILKHPSSLVILLRIWNLESDWAWLRF